MYKVLEKTKRGELWLETGKRQVEEMCSARSDLCGICKGNGRHKKTKEMKK